VEEQAAKQRRDLQASKDGVHFKFAETNHQAPERAYKTKI
jgi:hypothetical protein